MLRNEALMDRMLLLMEKDIEYHWRPVDVADEVVDYHFKLLLDAGLINGFHNPTNTGAVCICTGLTNAGHNRCNALRNRAIASRFSFVPALLNSKLSIAIVTGIATALASSLITYLLTRS